MLVFLWTLLQLKIAKVAIEISQIVIKFHALNKIDSIN